MKTPKLHERKPIDPASVELKAKAIMDAFLKEMQTVTVTEDFGLHRDNQTREPVQEKCDVRFQRSIIANAHAIGKTVKNDEIVMERKQW